ncbi:TIGR03943 family putative permease subunit [Enterococcus sp. LJL120]
MLRFLILSGYFEVMMYLMVTGKLDQYINIHYQYLAILSMILALVLALVQLYLWMTGKTEQPHQHEEELDHDHHLNKWYQKLSSYGLLIIPLLVATVFPTVSLDATIVEAKGITFPISEESVGDPEMNTQYLRPDTSIYYNDSDYNSMMETLLSKYETDNAIKVTDDNYLEIMEIIYNFPSIFQGKTIKYTGFVFQAPQGEANQIFAFRFGVIHCVADSGVFGLLSNLPAGVNFENNDWVTVEGVIGTTYYAPLESSIPSIQVTSIEKVNAPSNQYVYRAF